VLCVLVLIENNHPHHVNRPQSCGSGNFLWESWPDNCPFVCIQPHRALPAPPWSRQGVAKRVVRRPASKDILLNEDMELEEIWERSKGCFPFQV
jgi:hypothetical protein